MPLGNAIDVWVIEVQKSKRSPTLSQPLPRPLPSPSPSPLANPAFRPIEKKNTFENPINVL